MKVRSTDLVIAPDENVRAAIEARLPLLSAQGDWIEAALPDDTIVVRPQHGRYTVSHINHGSYAYVAYAGVDAASVLMALTPPTGR